MKIIALCFTLITGFILIYRNYQYAQKNLSAKVNGKVALSRKQARIIFLYSKPVNASGFSFRYQFVITIPCLLFIIFYTFLWINCYFNLIIGLLFSVKSLLIIWLVFGAYDSFGTVFFDLYRSYKTKVRR